MKEILELNLNTVKREIQESAHLANRDPDQITLLAVSKTVSSKNIETMAELGHINFAENYVQEGVEKIQSLSAITASKGLIWHFIGPIQSNKTRMIAEYFDWVQTIDRLKIAQRLSDQRPRELQPLQFCIQVNIDGGETKSGVRPDEALSLAKEVIKLPHMVLRGLMTIPDPVNSIEQQKSIHGQAKDLFENIKKELQSPDFDTLSMGMSADLKAAIEMGSTMVRVGTALFGSRKTA